MTDTGRVCAIGIGALYALAIVATVIAPFPQNVSENAVATSVYCANLTPALSIIGTSAYVEDLKTQTVLYEKNSSTQLPLASLTKLMTAVTASDTLTLGDVVTISKDALAPEGDSGLQEGERWRADDLVHFTLITSSNDGAHALALAAAEKEKEPFEKFLQNMNTKAASLGLTETFFSNDTGLDISKSAAGAYGSARDVAVLLSYAATTHPTLVEDTTNGKKIFTSLSKVTHVAENTSTVITALTGAIASKTGFTDLAGGNLAVIFEPLPGRAVVAVVLGSTREGRNSDMKILVESAKMTLKHLFMCRGEK